MNIFSLIKTHVSIFDIVQEYTSLKKAGSYWKGQCPFHHERTASFTVSPHKEIFYCFGCHKGGDVIAFIAHTENCTPMQAAKHLADRYAIQLPEETKQAFMAYKLERDTYTLAHEITALWCTQELKRSPDAQKYLKQRGITAESIEKFCLGYFPGGQQSIKGLLKAGKDKNLFAQDFIQAHILRSSDRQTLYSPYEQRIIFPIHDALGRPCGLGGRIFIEDDNRAKYYNSQDHPYFSKGSLLYGFHHAKKHIQDTSKVYLVEGYLDCIALSQAGFYQTVATLGTACTAEQIKNIARYAHTLYTVYDGDAAGQKAALKLTQLCWDVDLEPYVIPLPPTEDPCSLVAQGGDLTALIEKAVTIFEYFIQKTAEPGTHELSLHERMARIKSITDLIGMIRDPIKQEFLLQKAAAACTISLDVLKKGLARNQGSEPSDVNPIFVQNSSINKQIEISELEKKIFSAIISKKYLLAPEEYAFLKLAFSPYLFLIIDRLQDFVRDQRPFSLVDLCPDDQRDAIIALLMEDEVQGQGPALAELFLQFYKKQWKTIVNGVKIKIARAQKLNQHDQQKVILAQFQSLKQKLFVKDEI